MISAWRRSARAHAVLTTAVVVLSFGLAGQASAAAEHAPANGNGADEAAGASAHQSDTAAQQSGDPATTSGPGKSDAAKAGKSDTGESDTDTAGPGKSDAAKGRGSNGKDPADHRTSGTAGTSDDPSQPQPLSNADENQGGANGKCDAGESGPYCSTRDGSPSMNGNGGGNATGKPCAGCVGKADNKNPKGQYPNGSDRNAGYECDRNNGIGKTNPAHTGCAQPAVTPPVVTPPAVTPPVVTPPVVTPPVVTPPVVTPPVVTPPTILPEEEKPEVTPPTVAGVEKFRNPPAGVEKVAAPPAAVLPATGASALSTALAAAGFGLLLLGSLVLLRRRVGHS